MPRAATGDNATGAVRRKLPEQLAVSAGLASRYPTGSPHRSGMENCLHRKKNGFYRYLTYTWQLSGFGVEHGRLGKVVSLVGDCRPPPPGNPHRPPDIWGRRRSICGGHASPAKASCEKSSSASRMQRHGGIIQFSCPGISFKNGEKTSNLKILKTSEYFKISGSYFYCTDKQPVLEFGSFRSHQYGLWVVELPAIAITNVLGM